MSLVCRFFKKHIFRANLPNCMSFFRTFAPYHDPIASTKESEGLTPYGLGTFYGLVDIGANVVQAE